MPRDNSCAGLGWNNAYRSPRISAQGYMEFLAIDGCCLNEGKETYRKEYGVAAARNSQNKQETGLTRSNY